VISPVIGDVVQVPVCDIYVEGDADQEPPVCDIKLKETCV